MGAPAGLAAGVHVASGTAHLAIAIDVLTRLRFTEERGDTLSSRSRSASAR